MTATFTFHGSRDRYEIRREDLPVVAFTVRQLRNAVQGHRAFVVDALVQQDTDAELAKLVATEFFRALRSGKLRELSK